MVSTDQPEPPASEIDMPNIVGEGYCKCRDYRVLFDPPVDA